MENEDTAVDLPCVQKGDQQKLIEKTKEYYTLAICRALADKKERGYFWEKGLLLSRQIDPFYGPVIRIVLPASRRKFVLDIAHERTGYLGYRKVEMLIKSIFIWPFLSKEVRQHCASCQLCHKANKTGPRRVPMVNRPVITEIFEKIAVDIVGPLPKGKGGAEYLLAIMCMASRWPETIPLKSITAKAVADAMLPYLVGLGCPW